MNRLHRFGTALFTVGGTGASISFLALLNSYALPGLIWWAIAALAVCGVVAGVGYVIQHTFADPPQPPTSSEADDPERPPT